MTKKNSTPEPLVLKEVGKGLDMSRVHFMGWIQYAEYLKVLMVSSAHVYLTYPFVLSWSMLEAMAAECLVVGSTTAPVQEVIKDRENGLLVEFFSGEQLANRLDEALDHPDRMKEMRKRARATIVEVYDLKRRALPSQLALIKSLMAKSRAPKQGNHLVASKKPVQLTNFDHIAMLNIPVRRP